jgi:tetratricopeptide (TPR) repeat protein
MKFLLSCFCFIFFTSQIIFSQTPVEILQQAKDLLAARKYESAFKLLNNYDKQNLNPDIVLLKEEIALNYYVRTKMHLEFCFKDIPTGDELSDYRNKKGTYIMFKFSIGDVLDSLLKIYPESYKLNKGLGDYYFDVSQLYGDDWQLKSDTLFKLIDKNYGLAIAHNEADYLTYYAMGYIYLSREKFRESIPYFLKSVSMNKNYASSYYNASYACMYISSSDSALTFAKQSIDLFKDDADKADAARMAGVICVQMKNDKDAIELLERSNKLQPGNYATLIPLLNMYVKRSSAKARLVRGQIFKLDPASISNFRDLTDIYDEYGKEKDMIDFLQMELPEYQNNFKASGNIYFAIGRMQVDYNMRSARESILKARDAFKKVYDKNNEVFKQIEEALNDLN